MGAAPNLTIPQIGPDGIRRTVNTGISHYQTVWNMRSAYNVAALNCQKPEHAAILNGYKQFLKDNSKALTKVNGELDKQFKSDYGSKYIRERETYNTQVYNYFALPPTLPAFCDAALTVAQQSPSVSSSDLDAFAATSLAQLESVFHEFYNSYDQYRSDLAAWNARYGGGPPVATPVAASPVTVVDTSSTQSMAQ